MVVSAPVGLFSLVLLLHTATNVLATSAMVPFTFSSSCVAPERFDIAALECQSCGTDKISDNTTGGLGLHCQCAPPGINNMSLPTSNIDIEADFVCSSCNAANKAASRDGSVCMGCESSTGAALNGTDCVCPVESGPGYILVEFDGAGNRLPNKQCVRCPAHGRVFPLVDPYTCLICPHPAQTMSAAGVCQCPSSSYQTAGASCVPTSLVSSSFSVTSARRILYRDVRNSDGSSSFVETVESNTFVTYYLLNVVQCTTYRNRSACQVLANMCVLTMYDPTHRTCLDFTSLATSIGTSVRGGVFLGWKTGLPWLAYEDTSVLTNENLQGALSLSQVSATAASTRTRVTHLKYMLAKYAFNGSYLGMEELGSQLQLCGGDPDDNAQFLEFGTIFENKCDFGLRTLLNAPEPVLYDMYYVDKDNKLFPVPVRVVNYRDANGAQVNKDANAKLHRRFFLYDTLSSVTLSSDGPTVLVFAKRITLSVRLRSDPDFIFPPLLSIEYGMRPVAKISLTETNSESQSRVVFKAEYTKDLGNLNLGMVIVLVLCCVAVVLAWARKEFYIWQRISSTESVDLSYLVRLVIWLLGSMADVFFFMVFGLCSYAFIFYKGQSTAFFLLPLGSSSEVRLLTSFVILCFFAKFIDVFYMLLRQIHADLFFVDWEKPTGLLQTNVFEHKDSKPRVSAWRRLLVTNKWNEFQTARSISVPLTLFVQLLFLRALGLEYLTNAQPSTTDLDPSGSPSHPILRFAVNTFFLLLTVGVQLLFRHLFYHPYIEDKAADFVDLLTSTNISAFLFDAPYRLYYIHGESVFTHADVSLEEMNRQVATEEKSWTRPRGLMEGKDTWEVYVTHAFRTHYDKIYAQMLAQELRRQSVERRRKRGSGGAGGNDANEERSVLLSDRLIRASHELNQFLISFIRKADPNHPWEKQEKSTFMMFCKTPPPRLDDTSVTAFYDDPDYHFTRLVLMGIERHLAILMCLVYAVVDLWWENTFINILITYVADRVVMAFRSHFGRRNVSLKTLVDDRFLI